MEKEYPLNITLTKIETRADSRHSQEEKYPSGVFQKRGLMWEFTKPKVGEAFHVNESKLWSNYRTSKVEKIETIDEYTMMLTTENSVYKLEIDKD